MMKNLEEIEKKNPFRVPDNYFEEVNKRIISSVTDEMPHAARTRILVRMRPFLAVAASVALLVTVYLTGQRLLSGEGRRTVMSEISIQELSDAYLNELDIQTFEENLAPVIQTMILPELSKAEIIEYLISENIELSEIYENL